MATQVLTVTTPVALSADALFQLKREMNRQLKRTNGASDAVSSVAVTAVPSDAADTVAGTNGILSSAITWVKSTDASVVAQRIELVADSNGAVLATGAAVPATEAITLETTAVSQKARVVAINAQGETTSALSAAIVPTAS